MSKEADNWTGCYEGGWNGLIVPDAFSHPAKFSYALTRRMFEHARDNGWISPGSVVVDPFGGVGTGGIIAAYADIQWIGCELEQKFVDLARENFELHRRKWEGLNCPQPVIIQGDSREMCTVLGAADCVVSSPPFLGSQEGASVAGPSSGMWKGYEKGLKAGNGSKTYESSQRAYGQTPGQLGNLKPGAVDAVVSSPPFMLSDNRDVDKTPFAHKFHGDQKYGDENPSMGGIGGDRLSENAQSNRLQHVEAIGNLGNIVSSGNNGQLINQDTFWQAAKEIVQQCHQILKPGGHAIWVVKAFVRKGKRVDFPGDWRRLCESVGFKTVCTHHAMLVKETTDNGLFGEIKEKKEWKSFFRRLAESKGSPAIDFEVILCMEK